MVRATRIAANIGQGFAMVGGVYGLARSEPFYVLIAVFVFFGQRRRRRWWKPGQPDGASSWTR